MEFDKQFYKNLNHSSTVPLLLCFFQLKKQSCNLYYTSNNYQLNDNLWICQIPIFYLDQFKNDTEYIHHLSF